MANGCCGGGEVVEGGVAAVVHLVRGVVDGEEDQQVHGSEVDQQKAAREMREEGWRETEAHLRPKVFCTMASVVFRTMRSATDSSRSFRCFSCNSNCEEEEWDEMLE